MKKLFRTVKLPTFVIIGTMKGGTSSLHNYLDAHPEISMSKQKETDFFLSPNHGGHNLSWYKSQFDPAKPVRGETSPNYTKRHYFPGVPQRMHSLIPNAKLIYVVRDPIERTISNFMHAVHEGKRQIDDFNKLFNEPKGMKEDSNEYRYYYLKDGSHRRNIDRRFYMHLKGADYLNISSYHYQLENYLEYYPMSSVLVITSEDLLNKRKETLKSVFEFLGVDKYFESTEFNKVSHKTSDKFKNKKLTRPKPTASQLKEMKRFLSPDIDKFRALTGMDFSDWSI